MERMIFQEYQIHLILRKYKVSDIENVVFVHAGPNLIQLSESET